MRGNKREEERKKKRKRKKEELTATIRGGYFISSASFSPHFFSFNKKLIGDGTDGRTDGRTDLNTR